MIERFAEAKCTVARLRASAGAEYLDGFAEELFISGYSRRSGSRYVNSAAHLGNWCKKTGIAIAQLDERVLLRFLDHLSRCRCPGSTCDRRRESHAAAAHYLNYLRRHGIVAASRRYRATAFLNEFYDWMRTYRGVGESTLSVYMPLLAEFVARAGQKPEDYDASRIRAFVLRRAQLCASDRARSVVTALRMFLRFLSVSGRCSPDLIGAVPTLAAWRLAKLPRYMPGAEIEKLITVCDAATPKGARDRAMILLMARIGLRSGEVATLRLQDLDWHRGRLRLLGKGGKEALLPLPQEVGDAILNYIDHARPSVSDEHVFLRMVPPWRRLHTVSISDTVAAAMRAAGIEGRLHGGHMLRHSLATNLLRDGASLDQIGALLRHSTTSTTEIYAKVDVTTLRRVAQPWPVLETSPC